jgi:hypothetical protein
VCGAYALVTWSAVAVAQGGPRNVECRPTETQPECHARLKCKPDEDLEDCQRRLLKCRANEDLEGCKERVGAGDARRRDRDEDQAGGGRDERSRDRDADRDRDDRGDSDRRRGDRDDRGDDDRGGDDRGDDDRSRGRRSDRGRGDRGRGNRGGGSAGGGFQANKTFGFGLEIGEPTGLNGKYFLSDSGALDFGIGWIYRHYYYGDGLHLYFDYLWHPTSLASTPSLELPFYIGLGLRYWDFEFCDRNFCDDSSAIGIRVPVGIAFDFNNAPLDIFLQLVPVLDFISDDYYDRYGDRVHLGIDASAGIRFWFQ